jgi:hypothetical protein
MNVQIGKHDHDGDDGKGAPHGVSDRRSYI